MKPLHLSTRESHTRPPRNGGKMAELIDREKYKEVYLGDGLYASHDGYRVMLRAPSISGDKCVFMKPQVLDAFLKYVEGLKADAGREKERLDRAARGAK